MIAHAGRTEGGPQDCVLAPDPRGFGLTWTGAWIPAAENEPGGVRYNEPDAADSAKVLGPG